MTSPEQIIKLTAADAAAGDRFGVSVSTDGQTTLVGSYWDDDAGSETGSAYLSEQQADGSWSPTVKLTASDAAEGDRFGREISVHGNIAVVGAYLDDHAGGNDSGSAYIFERQADGSWLEIQKLTASDARANDYYGRSVDVYGDTMVVGSYQDDDQGRNSGSVYVYKRQSDGSWLEVAKLTAADGGKNDEFGYDVSIHGDTLIVGAQNDDDNGSNSGAAYIFKEQPDGSWSQVAKLGAADGAAGDLFGYSVSAGDGRVAVGAYFVDDGVNEDVGAAYVFEEQADGSWSQTTKLTASNGADGDRYGRDVALDGDKVLVGSYLVGQNAGASYLYEYQPDGSWQETSIFQADDTAANDRFGRSVSLAGDIVAVGAYRDADAGDETGAAYVFTTNPNSGPGAIVFDNASYTVAEDGGSATITVVRSGGSEGAVTVDLIVADGTATAADYTNASQTLSFADGETSTTITIDITDDSQQEGDETILLSLTNVAGGATLGDTAAATLTITANDNPGAIAFDASSYTITEDVNSATITLVRTAGSDGAVTVDVVFTDDTATAGSDYTIPATTVSFADGETTKTLSIPLLDDSIAEGNETVNLSLTNFTGGAIAGTQDTAIFTIEDNDVPGTLAFDTASYTVNEGDGTASITVVRTGGNAGTVSVDLALTDGSATAPGDYDSTTQTVTFADGETSKVVAIAITDDGDEESDETVNLSLSNVTGGASIGGQNIATLTIADNDASGDPVRIEAEDYIAYSDTTSGNAGDSTYRSDDVDLYLTSDASGHMVGGIKDGEWLEYEITLPTAGTYDIVVRAASPKTVGQSLDVTLGGQTYNLPITKTGGWQSWQDFTLAGVSLAGGTQTLRLTMNESRFNLNYVDFIPAGGPPTPIPGEIAFDASSYTVAEDGSAATITLVRTGGSDGEVSATVNLADGTAIASSDYDSTSQVVTFADGETTKVITVPIVNDTESEGDETVNLTLSNPTGGASLGATPTATLTIQANDQYGAIAFDTSTYSILETGDATITLVRTGGSDGAVSVDVSLTDGSATAPGDYTNVSQTVSFAAGETTKTIVIPIIDDTLQEGDETVALSLSNVTGGAVIGPQAAATLTIVDNDVPIPGEIAFDNSSYTVAEDGSSATITLVRTFGSDGEVQVEVTFTDGTAIATSDYDATPQVVTFADGETTKVITVPIIDDTVTESAETVNLGLANPTGGATLGTQSAAVLTIESNDQYGAIAFDSSSYTVAEDGTSATINLVRTGGSDGDVTIDVLLNDGSAIAPGDYDNTPQTITFLDGVTSQPVVIPIIDDGDEEGDETVGLSLSNATGGATLGTQDTATLTITDDETPAGPVRIEAEDYTNYSDTTNGNAGGVYRTDDVDIYTNTDASGFHVGGIKSGEWLEYDVTLPGIPGGYETFDVVVRVVSTKSLSHSIDLEIDGQTHTFNFGRTGNSWNAWTDITLEDVVLPAGAQSFRLTLNSTKFNLNYIEFIPTEPAAPSPGEISLDSSLYTVDEDAGTATITLTREGGDDGEVSVELDLADGSAIAPNDYTNTSPYTVTFADGVTTQTITVPIIDDTLNEGNETVNLSLSNATGGAALGTQDTATLVIQDNDSSGSGPIKILPLGDSITFGYGTDFEGDGILENEGGYRIRLEDLLANNNIGFDFVGSQTGGPASLADQDNEGHPGFRIDEIATDAAANSWFTNADPDVVLLMLGTNDLNQNYQIATAPDRISSLIDQVLADVPDAHVIVSTVPTTTKSWVNPRVVNYNATLPGIVNTKISEGKNVSLVDINSVISTDELADSLHPTLAGYNDAAGVWFDGILDILDNYGDFAANNDEVYVNAAITAADDFSTTLQADIVNNSAIAQSDLSLRYFVDLTELFDAGYGANDVLIGDISGPTVGSLTLWDTTTDVYYVDVDFAGTAIAPNTSVTAEFSIGIDTALPSSAWDQSNDWSAQSLTTSLDQTRYVPVYDSSATLISGVIPA